MPTLDVVIATANLRPSSLARCLEALDMQSTSKTLTVILCNDSSEPLKVRQDWPNLDLQCLQGPFGGPAAARNAGVLASSAEVVLFTDDDTVPAADWVSTAASYFADGGAGLIALEGRVVTERHNALRHRSVAADNAGYFLTCNMAYSRMALVEIGGFDESFPYPHCEDVDLGLRVLAAGHVRFAPDLVVEHPVTAQALKAAVGRAAWLSSEWRLHLKHPQTRPPRWGRRLAPLARLCRHWLHLRAEIEGPDDVLRWTLLGMGQLVVGGYTTAKQWEPSVPLGSASLNRNMRIAYVGPTPTTGGGVAGAADLVVRELSRRGVSLDLYLTDGPTSIDADLGKLSGVRLISVDTGWRWDRWYSRHPLTKLVTGLGARALARRRAAAIMIEQHAHHPYDVLYQFSTIETFGVDVAKLPPLILHPSAHMAGELRWFLNERRLSRGLEPSWKLQAVRALLTVRASRQRRDIQHAQSVVAISEEFGEELFRDYGVDRNRLRVIPYAINLETFAPDVRLHAPDKKTVLVVSRLSSRKGLEHVKALAERLSAKGVDVNIDVVGAPTFWSDYSRLFPSDGASEVRLLGPLSPDSLRDRFHGSCVLLHPAKYEPFGLVVAEALASGLPVIATKQTGAIGGLDSAAAVVLPAGDVAAMEIAVLMFHNMDSARQDALRLEARRLAVEHFGVELMVDRLLLLFREVMGGATEEVGSDSV